MRCVDIMDKRNDLTSYSVLLDTSFLIRLLKKEDPLHENAKGYFKYFVEQGVGMYISTISVSEYCVKGAFEDIPFRYCRIIPFNIQHAPLAGKYAAAIFASKDNDWRNSGGRNIIPNDTKLFAQGAESSNINYFITSDSKSAGPIKLLQNEFGMELEHLDIHTPHFEKFGIINI